VCSSPNAIKFGKREIIAKPRRHMGIMSTISNFFLKKIVIDNKKSINPVRPYRKKLNVNGSMFSTKSLVNTNVEPPSVAESEAKNVPKNKFFKNILSLFIKSYLLD
jgi:hypothetical protein